MPSPLRLPLRFGATCLAAWLVGCATIGPEPEPAAPPIRNIIKERIRNDEARLPIIESEPVAPNADKALENYRKLLEMAPDAETRAEAERRLADLKVQRDDLEGGSAEDSEQQLRQAIGTYQALLEERPRDRRNDRILYQLARAQQNSGDSDAAIATLERLTAEHPDSPLAGDGHFRRADLLYRLDRYADAEAGYATVMGYEDRTPFFEPAQYMMGWSQYRQSKFDAAIATFFDILDRELPAPVPPEVEDALAGVARGKTDLARDSLRVVSLSFAALGGGTAVSEHFARDGDPRFYTLVYNALGEMLLDKQRYTDAAEAYTAFTQRYPGHELAPRFQTSVITAYTAGGFGELVIREKERYATTYDPDAAYWGGRPATEEVLTALRGHLEDLAKFNHAQAQADKANQGELFLVAARWYQRILEVFPQDPAVAEINFLLADALLDGGRTLEAAEQYTRTAYDYAGHAQAGEAAQAAWQAYQKHAREVPPAQRPEALRAAVDSGIRLADTFPDHQGRLPVLTQSAQDLYEMKALDESITIAARVIESPTPAAPELRRSAWSVTANAQFSLEDFSAAETAYGEELNLTPADDPVRNEVIEQLAASIYKQGEAARANDDLRKAVDDFLRVGQVTPTSKIRANADYDAATSLVELEDWPAATQVLEAFRGRFPGHPLEGDVDKNLALAYEKDGKPALAAAVFERIAARPGEAPEIRREAAWQAAKLFDSAERPADSARTYAAYVSQYPRPLDRSMEARVRLVELAQSRGDREQEMVWHRDIVRADQTAGAERSDATRSLAADSSLALGRMSAADARRIRLTLPLEQTLASKKAAMESAIAALEQAAAYGFAETTTAATFEVATLYGDFATSLMESQRPPGLQDLELEQYELLIEEQAFPFEERAIQTHESNLKRILQGRYDGWVKRSAERLTELVPGRYAKREIREDFYESLR